MATDRPMPTKTELVDALRSSGEAFVSRLRELPLEDFEEGRYENGWNGRQILAHAASIEWSYPRLLDIAKEGTPSDRERPEQRPSVQATDASEASDTPTRTAQGGIDAYNQRQVDKRAGASVAELLAEFEKNRATTIAAVEAADEALLTTPIRSAGGVTGALSGVFHAVAVWHVLGHMNDILRSD